MFVVLGGIFLTIFVGALLTLPEVWRFLLSFANNALIRLYLQIITLINNAILRLLCRFITS
jgi:hypothetical protein